MIRPRYNEDLQKAGLDTSQALLRHTSARMTEKYAKLAVNEKVSQVVIQAEELFKNARERKSLQYATRVKIKQSKWRFFKAKT